MAEAAGGFIGRAVDTVSGGIKSFFALPEAPLYTLTIALAALACCCHAFAFTSVLVWTLLDLFDFSMVCCIAIGILRIFAKIATSAANQ